MADDNTTKHAGWMPASPSMNQGGALAPDWDSLGGGADDSTVKSAGQTMGSTPMTDSGGVIETRIMETGMDYEFPGSSQSGMEHTGPAVKGT